MDKYKKLIIAEFVTFGLSALSLLAIPFLDLLSAKVQMVCGYIFAAAFWCSLIAGFILTKIISNIKYIVKINYSSINFDENQKLPGIINFEIKPMKLVLYFLIVLGFVLMISDMFFQYINKFVMFPVISVTFYAFAVHSVIDGKSYKIYINANKHIKEGNENG